MINGVYGGIMYPHSSFVFDKVYDNYTAMMNGKASDGVLVGRYVLISYCDVPLTQDDRNAFEAIACGSAPKEGWTMPENSSGYLVNYKIDNGANADTTVTTANPISYDKTVYRKNLKNGNFIYEQIASLNSTVSDESIVITGLKAGDKVLSINNRVLQSDLNLTHNRSTDNLVLSGNQQINTIPISPMIADHLNTGKYLKYSNDNKLYVDISELVYDSSTKTIRLKDASGTGNKDSISTVDIFKDRVDYSNDRLLFFTDNDKLATGISLVYMPDSKVIQLLDKNDSCISEIDTTDFVKDGMIQSVTLESQDGNGNPGQFLKIVWNTDADVDADDVTYVDVTTLVDIYTSGNAAINIDNENKISLTIDGDSEKYIAVTTKGLKLFGIDNAIQTAKDDVANTVTVVSSEEAKVDGKNIGDICIVETVIDEQNHISRTAYSWNGLAWEAMDGNYNADNVYLDYDLIITKDIGVQTLGTNTFKQLNTNGKSLSQVLNMIVAKEEVPEITSQPSVTTKIGNGLDSTPHASNSISVEGGTTITPKWSATLSAGTYKYGPTTGITPRGWDVNGYVNSTKINGHSSNLSTGTFSTITLAAGDNYKINAKATYGEGALAYTNLGEEYKAGNALFDKTPGATSVYILSGNKDDDSPSITAWQQGYYIGTLENANIEINSNILRSVGDGAGILKNRKVKNSNYSTQTDLAFSATGTMAKFVIAYPASKDTTNEEYDSSKGLLSFFNNSSFEEYKNNFTRTIVKVAGADNDINSEHAIDYAVWTWAPAAAFSGTINFLIDLK